MRSITNHRSKGRRILWRDGLINAHRRRGIIIDRLVASKKGYVTGQSLADACDVSARTIREDIKRLSMDLAEDGISIDKVPGKGYRIDTKSKEKLEHHFSMQKKRSHCPATPDERVDYIVKELVFAPHGVSQEKLLNDLSVSESTLKNDLSKAADVLIKYELSLVRNQNDCVEVCGLELSKRYAMLDCVLRKDENRIHTENFPFSVDKKTIYGVMDIISSHIRDFEINISHRDYVRLVTYLVLALQRINEGCSVAGQHRDTRSTRDEGWNDLPLKILEKIGIQLSDDEVSCIFRLMESSEIFELKTPADVHENSLLRTLRSSIEDLKRSPSVTDFRVLGEDDVLAIAVFLASKASLDDNKSGEPGLSIAAVKAKYPMAFEMAVVIKEMASGTHNIEIDHEALVDLVLLCATSIEKEIVRKERSKKRAVIICSSGIGGSQLVAVKIKRYFPQVEILGVYPAYRLNEVKKDCDFIISTIDIKEDELPVVKLSPLFDEDDFNKINRVVRTLSHEDVDLNSIFVNLFKEDLFFLRVEAKDKNEVIHLLCKKAFEHGYAGKNFEEKVLLREEAISTALSNLVAIPHAVSEMHFENFIAVAILNKPMDWCGEKVQLVFLLGLNGVKTQFLSRLYERLFDVINSKNIVRKLIDSSDYDAFIDKIRFSGEQLGFL